MALRVFHYIERFDFGLGGVVQYVFQWVSALSSRGIDVTLATASNRDIPGEWLETGHDVSPRIRVLDRPAGPFGWLAKDQLDVLDRWVRENDCNVIHLHGPWDLGMNRWARRLRRCGLPYVVSTHGMLDDWSLQQKRWRKRLMLALSVAPFLRRATKIHCTAIAERQQIMKNVSGLNEPECIPPLVNWIEESEYPSPELAYEAFPRLRRDAFKILFLSRIHYKKGIEILLDAVSQLPAAARADIQTVIAGPGDADYVQQLQSRAQRLGISDRVEWLGMVRDPVKSALYRAADVFVLPTQQENFGIVLVEAMAARLPVITTRGTDIYRELEEGGAVISAFDGHELRQHLQRLQSDSAERARRSDLGRDYVLAWLDPQRVMEQQLSMYRNAVSSERPLDSLRGSA